MTSLAPSALATAATSLAVALAASLALIVVARGDPATNTRLCVVPVRDGTPTTADIGNAWRMVFKVLMLPGVPRPVIYPLNRGGVWTIDEHRRYVPFGGEFPAGLFDHYARDPATRRIAGVSSFHGLFVIDPGETQFARIAGKDAKPLRGPYDAKFIVRFGKFVVADQTGLYTFGHDKKLSPLPFAYSARRDTGYEFTDLPSLGALAIIEERFHEPTVIFLRFDDGAVVRLLALDRFESIKSMKILPNGKVLAVQTNRRRLTAPLPRKATGNAKPVPRVEPARRYPSALRGGALGHYVYRADVPSIGKTLLYSEKGLFELRSDGNPAPLPFPGDAHIREVAALPASHLAVLFAGGTVFALDALGKVSEVPGGRRLGDQFLDYDKGVIPGRNEMLVNGKDALFLIVDRMLSGNDVCPPLKP
jgi:hypothetical protein